MGHWGSCYPDWRKGSTNAHTEPHTYALSNKYRHALVNRRILLSWFFFHFSALLAVSLHETVRLISLHLTNIPSSIANSIHRFTSVTETSLGLRLPKANPIRQSLIAYLAFAGADAGYGYFSPNVPNSYELSFELRGADGRTELQSLRLASSDLGLRVASLVDQIGGASSPELREHMLKKIAAVIGRHRSRSEKYARFSFANHVANAGRICARKRQTAALLYATI